MHFGSGTFLNGVIDATATITVRWGPNTPYSVAIDNGQNFAATRRMSSGSGKGGPSYVPYEIYRNAIRTQRWGRLWGRWRARPRPPRARRSS